MYELLSLHSGEDYGFRRYESSNVQFIPILFVNPVSVNYLSSSLPWLYYYYCKEEMPSMPYLAISAIVLLLYATVFNASVDQDHTVYNTGEPQENIGGRNVLDGAGIMTYLPEENARENYGGGGYQAEAIRGGLSSKIFKRETEQYISKVLNGIETRADEYES